MCMEPQGKKRRGRLREAGAAGRPRPAVTALAVEWRVSDPKVNPPKARSRLEHKFDDIPKENPLTPQVKYCNEMYVLSVVSILVSYLSWTFCALQHVFSVLP